MDVVLLSRIQFALTIGFHFIFPPLTIGLSWLIFWIMTKYKKTGEDIYRKMARFWIKVFTLSFAIGVATGIVMEFQFGTNWSEYSRFVGDIFGAPLAAEGIFAFFLESSFLALLVLGWNRLSVKVHWFSSLMVAFGSTLSALWIIIANSWQQTPAGFEIVDGRAVLTNFWAAAFNPSTIPRYLHTVDAALISGAFFMMGLSAWFLLKGRHMEFAKRSLKLGLIVAFVTSALELGLGHYHAVQVANT
ncbi:cytochrome ubiquinol oxidase subunit I, partial [bacterium]|nr:cytochrome ubiquinol oxidase subunit I [bacterium]